MFLEGTLGLEVRDLLHTQHSFILYTAQNPSVYFSQTFMTAVNIACSERLTNAALLPITPKFMGPVYEKYTKHWL